MGQGAAQVLGQRQAGLVSEGARVLQLLVEVSSGFCQAEGLQLGGISVGVLAQQHEVAGVGHQHQPVQPSVLADLGAVGGEPGVIGSGLDLHHAALG